MRTLAIETSSEACSIALFEGAELVAAKHETIGRGHAERLVPMIAALPDRGHAQRINVSLGPGSFTGVRIGLAAGRALGLAWRAEVLGFSSMALLAAMGRKGSSCAVTVCINGGHGEWFVQNFAPAGEPLDQVRSLSPDDAASAAAGEVLIGNRAEDLAILLDRSTERVSPALPDARHLPAMPPASLTARLSPIYGRAPDARKPQ